MQDGQTRAGGQRSWRSAPMPPPAPAMAVPRDTAPARRNRRPPPRTVQKRTRWRNKLCAKLILRRRSRSHPSWPGCPVCRGRARPWPRTPRYPVCAPTYPTTTDPEPTPSARVARPPRRCPMWLRHNGDVTYLHPESRHTSTRRWRPRSIRSESSRPARSRTQNRKEPSTRTFRQSATTLPSSPPRAGSRIRATDSNGLAAIARRRRDSRSPP